MIENLPGKDILLMRSFRYCGDFFMEHTINRKTGLRVGSVSAAILRLAIPMTFAQLINVLYSVVDRIYIGHLPHTSTEALTGIGLTLPVITIVTAFANLFGMGGAPLFFYGKRTGKY